ncbi:DNA mismatch repair endonuclease MutL [Myroides odoratimimus]|uniref:DNA mismatch repair endonuclease MutL n=1 Tax=Myroides odoratimimus TaxID=76832 RepID=UPI00091A8416|nr:DNA mismatch repair endonuclease MutL [Myroides odoratimimus]SHM12822.1 DNA mismatch repair protein MutL [Myroides odoratimimus subsp. xuanwuensis]
MSDIIRLLPDHVANQIAAGEVVQRPSSVVKELIENSVDAGATEIKLILKEAGKTLIQVIDNGKGMSDVDARMSFERHATSKISKAEDLFALSTKGFRGEALASIAAIAHVELKTRTHEAELGTHIVIEGTKLVSQEVAVTPAGTSFSVKNLFFNIPARRNFLKSDNVEFRNIIDEFERIVLVHHNIHFSLIHNGSEVFNLLPTNARQRIVNVFGTRTNEKLVPIKENTEIVEVTGFVGKPEFAKKSRGEQFFFVNDRFVKSGYLHHAIMAAYEGLLKEGTHPSYFIYFNVPPDSIDINIHPTKTEVKFDDEQALYSILRSIIKHSLGQFNVAPVLDFQRDASLDTPYDFEGKEASTPTIEVDRNFNPFHRELLTESDKFEYNPFDNNAAMFIGATDSSIENTRFIDDLENNETYVSMNPFGDKVTNKGNDIENNRFIDVLESKSNTEENISLGETLESKSNHSPLSYTDDLGEVLESKGNNTVEDRYEEEITLGSKVNKEPDVIESKFNKPSVKKSSSSSFSKGALSSKSNIEGWENLYEGLRSSGEDLDVSGIKLESDFVTGNLFENKQEEITGVKRFQINRKYIVSPIKSGMVIIDQGRAHQRILYEKFMESIQNHTASSQQLLFPLTLYYSPYEVEILRELYPMLQQTGFGFEHMTQDYVVISGLPVNISESEASIVLEDLISDFQDGVPKTAMGQSDRIAKSLAHSLSVKTGTVLNDDEQENIVNSLFACQEPSVSPFMKPTFVTMKVEDIEKKFAL